MTTAEKDRAAVFDTRQSPRLQTFDYSQNGCYFITICVRDKQPLLGTYRSKPVVRAAALRDRPQDAVRLTKLGEAVEKSIRFIDRQNEQVTVQNWVVMPNHVHLLIRLGSEATAAGSGKNPSLQRIVGNFKSYTTKLYWKMSGKPNKTLWQRRFYDHIIRNQREYENIWNYITYNAFKDYKGSRENPW